jgi:hypothetical protein
MRRHRLGALALAAAAALTLAGCGDDEETTTTPSGASGASGVTGAALTEDEFVSQANEICAQGGDEIDQAIEETFGNQQPSEADLEQFATDVLVPGIQAQIDGVRALAPPEEIAADVETFLDDAEAALGEVEADPSLLLAGDTPDDPFADVNAQAEALGLTECAD